MRFQALSPDRSYRVAETLRAQLATVVLTEVGDPRISMLSVTAAKVNRDLSVADVYVSSLAAEDADARVELVAVLNRAAGFLRSAVARRMDLRNTPRLRFHYDELPEQGPRLDALIRQAAAAGAERPGGADAAACMPAPAGAIVPAAAAVGAWRSPGRHGA